MTDNSNEAPKLLPCPFCGGKATTWLNEAYSCDSAEYVLGCDKCNIYTPFNTVFGGSKPTVVDVICWNTRAALPRAAIDAMLKAERARAYERAAMHIRKYHAITGRSIDAVSNEIRALAQEAE